MASSSTYKRKRESSADESQPPSKWLTRRAQEAYSSKLFDALRLVRAAPAPACGRDVRDAADRALAAAARGQSRWSRAILARRRRQRQRSTTLLRARAPMVPTVGRSSSSCSSAQGQQQGPAVARKATVLGRLVPGCRKLPFLAEVSDYIAALEMQVRTMNAVAQALSSVSTAGGSSPS